VVVSRPSVRRSEYERKKDISLIWLVEWLRDIEASLEVIYDIVGAPSAGGVSKFEANIKDLQNDVEALIAAMESEP